MDGGRKNREPYKLSEDRRERKLASGMSGDPKKGGRSSKFTWEGAHGYTDEDLHLINNKAAASKKMSQDDGEASGE